MMTVQLVSPGEAEGGWLSSSSSSWGKPKESHKKVDEPKKNGIIDDSDDE